MQDASPPPLPARWTDQLRIVLVRPRNPLNIGAAARAMSNFGFRTLRLVAPWEPSYLGARSAVGASLVLLDAKDFGSVGEAVADCALVVGTTAARERELHHALCSLPEAAELVRRRLALAPVALLFGSEKTGLSNQELAHCHWLLRIPTGEQHESMNLGQAVAVCLYELVRGSSPQQAKSERAGGPAPQSSAQDDTPAAAADVERMTGLLLESLCTSGYIESPESPATQDKLRRMLRRLSLNQHDAELWLGMLRKILWKLKHTE